MYLSSLRKTLYTSIRLWKYFLSIEWKISIVIHHIYHIFACMTIYRILRIYTFWVVVIIHIFCFQIICIRLIYIVNNNRSRNAILIILHPLTYNMYLPNYLSLRKIRYYICSASHLYIISFYNFVIQLYHFYYCYFLLL